MSIQLTTNTAYIYNLIRSNVKDLTIVATEWFKQLPNYQKIITCVVATAFPIISRSLYIKLHRKYYNLPPTLYGLPLIGIAPWFAPSTQKYHQYLKNNDQGTGNVFKLIYCILTE